MANSNRVVVEILADAKGFEREIRKANRALGDIQKSAKSSANSLQFFREAAGVATLGIAIHELGKAFIDTNIQMQKLEKGFTAVMESMTAATQELEYARDVAERLGTSYLDISKSLLNLTAATKNSMLEAGETHRIFEAIIGTMSKLGKSTYETENAVRAIVQMFNKGKVQAEEWKNQLGEVLPGSMDILSEATGRSTEELFMMMEAGTLLADDVIPKVATVLEDLYDTDERMEGLQQSWNRYKDALRLAAIETDKTLKITQNLADALDAMSDILSRPGGTVDVFDLWAKGAARTFLWLSKLRDLVLEPFSDRERPVGVQYSGYQAGEFVSARQRGELAETDPERSRRIMEGIARRVSRITPTDEWQKEIDSYASAMVELNALYEAGRDIITYGDQPSFSYEDYMRVVTDLQDDLYKNTVQKEIEKQKRDAEQAANKAARDRQKAEKESQREEEEKRRFDLRVGAEIYRMDQAYQSLIGTLDEATGIEQKYYQQQVTLAAAMGAGVISAEEREMWLQKAKEQRDKDLKDLKDDLPVIEDLAEGVGDAFANAFGNMITGAQSFEDALASLEKQLINVITQALVLEPLKRLISGTISGIAGGEGFGAAVAAAAATAFTPAAMGGQVGGNQPLLVGERGPEIFVPRGGGGTVIPNHQLPTTSININFNGPVSGEGLRQNATQLAALVAQQTNRAAARTG